MMAHRWQFQRPVSTSIFSRSYRPISCSFYRVLPSFTGFYRVLLGFAQLVWVDLSFNGSHRVLMVFVGALLGSSQIYLVFFLLGFTEFHEFLTNFRDDYLFSAPGSQFLIFFGYLSEFYLFHLSLKWTSTWFLFYLMGFLSVYRFKLDFYEFLPGFNVFLPGFDWFYWVLLGFTGF